jgi:hypothetical protein
MGKRAEQARRETRRKIRAARLTEEEKAALRASTVYGGSPHHKRNPGNFGLTPPAAPRLDKTMCDEAASSSELARLISSRWPSSAAS